jgi:hypothetical protein
MFFQKKIYSLSGKKPAVGIGLIIFEKGVNKYAYNSIF